MEGRAIIQTAGRPALEAATKGGRAYGPAWPRVEVEVVDLACQTSTEQAPAGHPCRPVGAVEWCQAFEPISSKYRQRPGHRGRPKDEDGLQRRAAPLQDGRLSNLAGAVAGWVRGQ